MFQQYFETLRVPFQMSVQFYRDWWYLLVPAVLSVFSIDAWKKYIKDKFWKDMDFVLISFNVPPELEKSPKFMDQFFSAIFGIQALGSWSDRFWRGRQQLYLSLEMVGIGGVVKLIIWMPKQIRDYIEAQLYADYPEAEVTEVADYTKILDWETLDTEYAMNAAELKPTKDNPYPIRTYEEFEDESTGTMMDPVANIAEMLSSLLPGECAWIQIIASPSENKFYKEGLKIVDKIFKRKEPEKGILPKIPLMNELLDTVQHVVTKAPGALFEVPEGDKKKEKAGADMEPMINISPGERNTLEAMEENMAKLGYDCKIRLMYAAPKDIARPNSIFASLFGVFWQLAHLDRMGLAPNKKVWTSVDYFFPKLRTRWRKKQFWQNYVGRKHSKGGKSFVLSTAELATIFHPYSAGVHAPNLERIESRKAEPPHNLPVV